MGYSAATKPTFYFIGVTTGKSSIVKVFPEWAEYLGLGDVEIKGIDMALHDTPARYREVVAFLKTDPLSLGALVTTHKLDLFAAAHDMFDVIDPHVGQQVDQLRVDARIMILLEQAQFVFQRARPEVGSDEQRPEFLAKRVVVR